MIFYSLFFYRKELEYSSCYPLSKIVFEFTKEFSLIFRLEKEKSGKGSLKKGSFPFAPTSKRGGGGKGQTTKEKG